MTVAHGTGLQLAVQEPAAPPPVAPQGRFGFDDPSQDLEAMIQISAIAVSLLIWSRPEQNFGRINPGALSQSKHLAAAGWPYAQT